MKTYPIYISPKWKQDRILSCPQCVCCGRPVKGKGFITQATTGWSAVDEPETIPNSQGYFDVGSECAKKFPKEFLFKYIIDDENEEQYVHAF